MKDLELEPPSSRDVEDALRSQRKLLARLTRSEAISRGDAALAIRQLTEVAAQLFRVDRTSVWRLDRGLKQITCIDLFERRSRTHSEDLVLREPTAPSYFRALEEERSIAAHDAARDPRTREMRASYLGPLGIGAMLDAPFFVHGEMAGVVCVEHVGPGRQWQPWEEILAGNLADFVALALEAEERVQAQAELRQHQAHLEALVAVRTAALEDANAALRASERNLRTLFAASPVAIVLVRTSDQVVRLGNARAAELFGLPLAEVAGQHATDFYEDPEDRVNLIARVRESGRAEDCEMRLRSKVRGVFPAAVSASLLSFEGEEMSLIGIHDLTPQKDVEAQLREIATRDPLTGIYNRRHFFEVASRELARTERYERGLAVAMLDVDHFKTVNDTHGHLAGDEVLRSLAATLSESLRAADLIARYGGEEFVALMPETQLDEAVAVVERLREAVAKKPIETSAGLIPVTVSAGVVAWQRGDDTILKLVGRADDALYAAKEAGRDRVVAH